MRDHDHMAELSASKRARLPDSAFAYIDSQGRRRLPINDENHVRNALARFGRVAFEDDAARQKALARLLRAAKKYRIVPVGFVTQQLQARSRPALPTGMLTLLFADIEDSTGHLRRLGDRYGSLLTDVRTILRRGVRLHGGYEVDARADEVFAVFPSAPSAAEAALAVQRAMGERAWPDGVPVRVRIGLHRGRPTQSDGGYVGLAVNTAARICEAGHGGQTLVSAAAAEGIQESLPAGASLNAIGAHRLRGLRDAQALFQLDAEGLPSAFPPLRLVTQPEVGVAAVGPRGLGHHALEQPERSAVVD
jgi:class 3 adenylate cyclase